MSPEVILKSVGLDDPHLLPPPSRITKGAWSRDQISASHKQILSGSPSRAILLHFFFVAVSPSFSIDVDGCGGLDNGEYPYDDNCRKFVSCFDEKGTV